MEEMEKGFRIFVKSLVNQYWSIPCIIYTSFNTLQLPRQQGPVIDSVEYLHYIFPVHHSLPIINSFDIQVEYLSECRQCLSSHNSQNLHFFHCEADTVLLHAFKNTKKGNYLYKWSDEVWCFCKLLNSWKPHFWTTVTKERDVCYLFYLLLLFFIRKKGLDHSAFTWHAQSF